MRTWFDNRSITKKDLLQLLKAYKEIIDLNAICSVTDPEGKIIYVNDKFCEISKYSREELLGQDHRIVNSNYHPSSMFKELWETIKSGKVWRSDVKSKAKDGTFFWLDSTIVPIHDENGVITEYFSLRTPIDDRKRIEEEQKEYVKNLEKMLFMVSHEVRHPVSQILGIVQILQEHINLDAESSELISNLKISAADLDLFTKKLSSFMHELRPESEISSDESK
ncbi:PAS domain-containing protein [Daejeonella sp.]|uniref:PAS domain-containing protein n=1 Tax=Daejeonella sp. TaxID=2805397 RepID=UPI0027220B2B|nr:PAS domain S-box protein [Daejeonella sp.]MDO8992323.1 PAS domain S-box protein [Daejeonella sp.]MDP2412640.1 PAS domain S-box protein [Daejeonella sp.]